MLRIIIMLSLLAIFPTSAMARSSIECTVLSIYDGDTMTLRCVGQKVKVRLYCIDTAEMKQTPWGIQARDYLRSITPKKVSLVKIDTDRYGRIVGEVYSDQLNLNLALIKASKAAVYNTYCKKPEYKKAERHAKKSHNGIWSQSGLHQTPWIWRRKH